MDTFPTAEMVARVIVVAARELGADPEAVARGDIVYPGAKGDHGIARARAYAAFALRATFDGCGATAISRMVGVSKKSEQSYLGNVDFQKRNGRLKWWDEALLARVIAASRPAEAPASTSSPAASSARGVLRESSYPPLNMRRSAAKDAAVVTADFMGDPPKGKSMLDTRGGSP